MTAELAVLAADPTSLDVFDDPGKQIELACQRANAWLKAGIDVRIETIVETKAQAVAVAGFVIHKQLGHDAELAALEVQRRAERGIGLAIRRGQEQGDIATPDEMKVYAGKASAAQRLGNKELLDERKPAPSDFVKAEELTGNQAGIYHLTDGVSDEAFDDAIEQAKDERNLSRANVVRKVKGEKTPTPRARAVDDPQRLERIRTLAGKGWSSTQIGREIGNGEEYVRQLARDYDIDIPADKVIGRSRRIDSNKVAAEIVAALDGLALPLRLVNFEELDAANAAEWANSLTESIRALNRFAKQMKELAQ